MSASTVLRSSESLPVSVVRSMARAVFSKASAGVRRPEGWASNMADMFGGLIVWSIGVQLAMIVAVDSRE